MPSDNSGDDLQLTERDIQFECDHCGNILIVDRDGAGLELECPHCGESITVPQYEGDPRPAPEPPPVRAFDFSGQDDAALSERVQSLDQRLKENASQRMETQGHINQLTIQLHRHTLQKERLDAKRAELEAERQAAADELQERTPTP